MSMSQGKRDQISRAADIAQVDAAEAAKRQARTSVDALKAAQAAAEASRSTAKWTLLIAIVMAVSVLADILFRIF